MGHSGWGPLPLLRGHQQPLLFLFLAISIHLSFAHLGRLKLKGDFHMLLTILGILYFFTGEVNSFELVISWHWAMLAMGCDDTHIEAVCLLTLYGYSQGFSFAGLLNFLQ